MGDPRPRVETRLFTWRHEKTRPFTRPGRAVESPVHMRGTDSAPVALANRDHLLSVTAQLKIRSTLSRRGPIRGPGDRGEPFPAGMIPSGRVSGRWHGRKDSVCRGWSGSDRKVCVGRPRPARSGVWSPRAPLDAKPTAASSARRGDVRIARMPANPSEYSSIQDGVEKLIEGGKISRGHTPRAPLKL